MEHTARHVMSSLAAIAVAEGIPAELLALPPAGVSRVPWVSVVDAIGRLEVALGGPRALEEAAFNKEVWPGTSVFARETRSSYGLSRRLFETVLADDFPRLQVHWEDLGPDMFRVALTLPSAPPSTGFASLLTGLSRAIPLFFGAPPAHAEAQTAGDTVVLTVTLPPHESVVSSSVSAHLGRSDTVDAVMSLLEDRALYREQRDNTQRVALALAEGFAREGSSEEIAAVVLRVVVDHLAVSHALLWAGPLPRERRLLASVGQRLAQSRVLSLQAGDQPIGILELEATQDAGFVEALLPWIAGEIGRRLARERSAPAAPKRVPVAWGLTPRQTAVAALLVSGLANKEIALSLGCSPGTVEDHLTVIYRKAAVTGRGELLAALWDHDAPPASQRR